MTLAHLYTLEDVRLAARRRLPRMVADFIDGGAEDEITVRRNRTAFETLQFDPRYLAGVSERDLSTTLFGTTVPSPVMFAPTGLARVAHRDGELGVARAAGALGSVFVLGVFSSYTLEEVAEAATGPLWFQTYLWRDRGVTQDMVARARAAGYQALVLTVDLPVIGQRERDLHNGMTIPVAVNPRTALDVARRPAWLARIARDGAPTFANMRGIPGAEGNSSTTLISYVNSLHDPGLSWRHVSWLRELWDGPLLLKGLLNPEDAHRAAAEGVDGVIVSNHGGRQLDGAAASIEALPRMVDAVGDRGMEMLLDSGVRRGSDVIKSVALGARACLVGRPYWWGLGAGGEGGVRRVLEILHSEIDRTLALVGKTSLADVDGSILMPPAIRPGEGSIEAAAGDAAPASAP